MPSISFKFNTPQLHIGQPVLHGCKIVNMPNVNRDSVSLAYQLGLFQEDADGYELAFAPLTSNTITLTGDTLSAFAQEHPNALLTREQDLIVAAYKAICQHWSAQGQDWRGKVRVNNTVFLDEFTTEPTITPQV